MIIKDKEEMALLEEQGLKDSEEYETLDKKYHHDLELGALYLVEAMDVALICFAFPIRTIQIMIFSYRTRRNYKVANFNTIVDLLLFTGVLVWFIRYEYLVHLPAPANYTHA